ncbi:HIT family protein [Clostridium akagii]|uniref:HIT family protein n=1 Tax=Clostridium akagii TaxID=91623 RepID=UPI000560BA7B|nr:DeoR family transcriptional regulator [Clostridium akagii]
MDDWKKDRIGSAVRGNNPTVLAKMKSGFAVIGDPQFLTGYCILLGYPKVNSLNDLKVANREDFLIDMSLIGDAITAVCNPLRVNYDILGNTDAFLHAHIFPRYEWEDEERIKYPVWLYPKENWSIGKYQFSDEKHGELKIQLIMKLQELMKKNYK